MIPPKTWLEGDITHKQYVSRRAASRNDIISLQKALDENLLKLQARDHGICSTREELFNQAFDEVIRQVTIESPERGLLLMRVKDEIGMTIDAYKTLYEGTDSSQRDFLFCI